MWVTAVVPVTHKQASKPLGKAQGLGGLIKPRMGLYVKPPNTNYLVDIAIRTCIMNNVRS